ncbi:OmpA family protein [Sinomicrobium weinanense]|uniref:OmpA family protein n=1 Tax=Sinomicrobium weinanense TaxID=2842200 RepID=A0A926JP52_9FLAO|nr:OmpA family protein [Sinomicrobium weinanense]MBC9794744.1 OmpA family protein [Sinomicrobium weinanense]MBU3125003.1 OmpA family protein [Sinomicrobium weinanense]
MKTIKFYFNIILVASLSITFIPDTHAQLLKKLKKKAEKAVERKLERKVEKEIENVTDSILEPNTNAGEKKRRSPVVTQEDNATQNVKINSRFDFVAGDKVWFYDDFAIDRKGDFPAKWNTNGSGEVVSISGREGEWLRIPDRTLSYPETGGPLPENFTVEFSLYYPAGIKRSPVTFGFSGSANPAKSGLRSKALFYFKIAHFKKELGYSTSVYSGRETNKEYPANKMAGKVVKVSISVNGTRIRLYMDQEKIFDLPRAFEPESLRNSFYFQATALIPAPEDGFYITGLRIAEAGKDIRSTLYKDGKWSTSGIQFAVNSFDLMPGSYGILKEIAGILQEDPALKLKITGHTDSDGTMFENQELSFKRAEAVRQALVNTYHVKVERLFIEGKGETEPLADNISAEGRAHNRRVEFIKL